MFRLKQTLAVLIVGITVTLFASPTLAAPYGTGVYGDCPYQAGCSAVPSGGSSASGGGTTTRPMASTGTSEDAGSSPEAPPTDTNAVSPTSPKSNNQSRKIATLQDDDEKSFYERNKLAIYGLGGVIGVLTILWLLLLFAKRRSRTTRPIF